MICEINNYEIIKKYQDKIKHIKEKISDLSEPLEIFAKYYSGIIKKNYDSDGEIFTHGTGWKSLNKNYLEWKKNMLGKKLENGKKVVSLEKLRLTDTLRKEVFSKKIFKVSKDKIEYNIYTIYGKIHQEGGYTDKGKIPARPFLYSNKEKGLRKEDITIYFKILEKYLLQEEKNE